MTAPVDYLGPPGTFGELAARVLAGGRALRPQSTHREILRAVDADATACGVIALENSREGVVPGSLVGLVHETQNCLIAGEHLLQVRFALLRRPSDDAPLVGVIGHPMALAQCGGFIERHGLSTREAASNAAACAALSDTAPPGWAALGLATTAGLYGLVVHDSSVGDDPEAVTRFVLLSHTCPPPTGSDRTALAIAPSIIDIGSLLRVILEFNLRQINLAAVKSIPSRGVLGTDLFLFECPGHIEDDRLREIVAALLRQEVGVRFLGSFPVDPVRMTTATPTGFLPPTDVAAMLARVSGD